MTKKEEQAFWDRYKLALNSGIHSVFKLGLTRKNLSLNGINDDCQKAIFYYIPKKYTKNLSRVSISADQAKLMFENILKIEIPDINYTGHVAMLIDECLYQLNKDVQLELFEEEVYEAK